MVIAKRMEPLVTGSSIIRKLFEEGKEMAKKVGTENVYDYSLGNPSVRHRTLSNRRLSKSWIQRIRFLCMAI